jgi:F-type H+-transporting ATPase subunit delta
MAGRYAVALHELARESGSAPAVSAALGQFQKMIDESADLARLVRSPAFSAEEQTRAVSALLDKAGIGGLAAKFIKLVAAKRRLFAVPDMISAFNRLEDSANGVTRAEAIVAAPLDAAQTQALREEIAKASGGRQVEIDVKVDPSILGGVVVKLGSKMIDTSLKTKLNALRTRMKEVG